MTLRVVDLLEPVEIDHHATQIHTVAVGVGEKLGEDLLERPSVVAAGHRINACPLFGFGKIGGQPRCVVTQQCLYRFTLKRHRTHGEILLDGQRDRREIRTSLNYIIRGAAFDRLTRKARIVLPREHHHWRARSPPDLTKQIKPVAIGKIDIAKNQVEVDQGCIQRLFTSAGNFDAPHTEVIFECFADQFLLIGIVLHDEELGLQD